MIAENFNPQRVVRAARVRAERSPFGTRHIGRTGYAVYPTGSILIWPMYGKACTFNRGAVLSDLLVLE